MPTFNEHMSAALSKVGTSKVDPLLQLFRDLCSEKNFLFGTNFDAASREMLVDSLYTRAKTEMDLGLYWMLVQRSCPGDGEDDETELDFVDVYSSEAVALANASHTTVSNGDAIIIDLHERRLWWLDVTAVRDIEYVLDPA